MWIVSSSKLTEQPFDAALHRASLVSDLKCQENATTRSTTASNWLTPRRAMCGMVASVFKVPIVTLQLAKASSHNHVATSVCHCFLLRFAHDELHVLVLTTILAVPHLDVGASCGPPSRDVNALVSVCCPPDAPFRRCPVEPHVRVLIQAVARPDLQVCTVVCFPFRYVKAISWVLCPMYAPNIGGWH